MPPQKSSLKKKEKLQKLSEETAPNSFTNLTPENQGLETKASMVHYKRGGEGATLILDQMNEKDRTDNFGNRITGDGKQKICFKNPLKTIHQVENWKDLNVVEDKEGVCSSCRIY